MITSKISISNIIGARRLDVSYFLNVKHFGDYVSLSKYVEIKGGKRVPKGESFSSEETDNLYLRLSDVDNFESLNYGDFKYISDKLFQTLSRYEIKEGQLAISIAGTIGKLFIVKDIPNGKKVILTENCAKILMKSADVSSEYIKILLSQDFVQDQINANRIKTTIPKLGLDRIGKLQIPMMPSIETQQYIIDIYDKAQDAKQAKEAEAKVLLASIDSEILEQLGISTPQSTERRLSFNVGISDMIGKRMDVSFYKDRFELISTLYPNKKLSDVVIVNPSVNYKTLSPNDEISFLPMEVIDEKMGEIAEYRTTTVAETKGFTKFVDNDLLWAKITPCMQNGKSAIARNLLNGVGCGSTEFFVLRPKDATISIDYIYCLLRHHKVLEAAKSSFGGSAGQQRVSSSYLKSISIPVPPIEVQKEIAENIATKKAKAKQLQQEGAELLKEAKGQIERIILG